MNKRKFGNIGEKVAQTYLINNEYKIVTTNFYTRRGEIDIIAEKDDILIFVEVKSRTNYNYGTPAMAVNYTKVKHMKFAAKVFLMLNNFKNYDVRFDVIEVVMRNGKFSINHIKQII